MNNDHKNSGQFDAALPLPDEVKIRHTSTSPDDNDKDEVENPAVDLIRHRVDAAYQNAPPAAQEVDELSQLTSSISTSRHQQYIQDLINSGKSLPEIQTAWHEYYAGLPDNEKHQVWQEFYDAHERSSQPGAAGAIPGIEAVAARRSVRHAQKIVRKVSSGKAGSAGGHSKNRRSKASPIHSLLFGLGMGSLVMIIFLFSFFNERFIAPLIQPSRNVTNTPIISDTTTPVSSSPEIIIPEINVEIPVIYGVDTINANDVENALEDGVVHYADTAEPGQDGNGVIVGHSSNNIFNPGKYKFAFVLLSRLQNGDTFYLDKNGIRYTYQVYKESIVSPTDVAVLGPQDKPATFSLITCDPPGTSTNRLVVVGQQISPDPSTNIATAATNTLATKAAIIPGNSPSLWSRLVGIF